MKNVIEMGGGIFRYTFNIFVVWICRLLAYIKTFVLIVFLKMTVCPNLKDASTSEAATNFTVHDTARKHPKKRAVTEYWVKNEFVNITFSDKVI